MPILGPGGAGCGVLGSLSRVRVCGDTGCHCAQGRNRQGTTACSKHYGLEVGGFWASQAACLQDLKNLSRDCLPHCCTKSCPVACTLPIFDIQEVREPAVEIMWPGSPSLGEWYLGYTCIDPCLCAKPQALLHKRNKRIAFRTCASGPVPFTVSFLPGNPDHSWTGGKHKLRRAWLWHCHWEFPATQQRPGSSPTSAWCGTGGSSELQKSYQVLSRLAERRDVRQATQEGIACTGRQRAPGGVVPGAPVRVCRGALGGAACRLRGRAPRPPPRAAGCDPTQVPDAQGLCFFVSGLKQRICGQVK